MPEDRYPRRVFSLASFPGPPSCAMYYTHDFDQAEKSGRREGLVYFVFQHLGRHNFDAMRAL